MYGNQIKKSFACYQREFNFVSPSTHTLFFFFEPGSHYIGYVHQTDLDLTKILLSLHPEFWDPCCVPLPLAILSQFLMLENILIQNSTM